jgi:hypothetical protein
LHKRYFKHRKWREAMGLPPKRAALLLAASWLALAGCATEEELRKRDEAICISYGFQRGTIEFSNCLQRENIARRFGYGFEYPLGH